MDWRVLETVGRLACGPSHPMDPVVLASLESRTLEAVERATEEVFVSAELCALPAAELVLVDRRGWVSANARSLEAGFGEHLRFPAPQAQIAGAQLGGVLGFVARAVLGQFDPFCNVLLVVYPNLGPLADDEDALAWLLFHEVTHVAQFRRGGWISDYVAQTAGSILKVPTPEATKEMFESMRRELPAVAAWIMDAVKGKENKQLSLGLATLAPAATKASLESLNCLATVLEGHATYVTDLIADRVLPPGVGEKFQGRRRRGLIVRILEALTGMDVKRNQYRIGRTFVQAVFEAGGPARLDPFWDGPDAIPTTEELENPELWLARTRS